jgi:tyrosyl-tRNA synthetase
VAVGGHDQPLRLLPVLPQRRGRLGGHLLKVFSDLDAAQIEELERGVVAEPFRRAAQRRLAADITTLVHGAAATAAVQAASEAIFGKGDLGALDAATWRDAAAELPRGEVAVGATVVDALVATGLVESRNAARRVLAEGGVSVNNVKVSDPETVLEEAAFLHGYAALLRRGRKAQAAAVRTE